MYKVRKNYIVKVGRTVLKTGSVVPEILEEEVLKTQAYKVEEVDKGIGEVILNKVMGKEKVKER